MIKAEAPGGLGNESWRWIALGIVVLVAVVVLAVVEYRSAPPPPPPHTLPYPTSEPASPGH